jgi:non-homologous end joining protein Ku
MLVEGMVGLFVLLPNPQLKGKEQEVMKIAYELLEERLNEDFQPKEDDDGYDDYINYLVEKHK